MSEIDRFERQLEARLLARVDGAVRPFDPVRVTRGATADARRQTWAARVVDHRPMRSGWGAVTARGALVVLLLLTLVTAAVGLLGTQLLEPSPRPVLERQGLGALSLPRCGATGVGLADGGALVIGGRGESGIMSTGERLDPVTGLFRPVGGSAPTGGGSSATLLADGRVLIAGGRAVLWVHGECLERERAAISDAYIFDPEDDRIEPVAPMLTARLGHASILLDDGRVLIVGGKGAISDNGTGPLDSAKVFDPVTATFQATGSMVRTRSATESLSQHEEPHAARLSDGRVLVTGGLADGLWEETHGAAAPYAEVYDPATGLWSLPAPDLRSERRTRHGPMAAWDPGGCRYDVGTRRIDGAGRRWHHSARTGTRRTVDRIPAIERRSVRRPSHPSGRLGSLVPAAGHRVGRAAAPRLVAGWRAAGAGRGCARRHL